MPAIIAWVENNDDYNPTLRSWQMEYLHCAFPEQTVSGQLSKWDSKANNKAYSENVTESNDIFEIFKIYLSYWGLVCTL